MKKNSLYLLIISCFLSCNLRSDKNHAEILKEVNDEKNGFTQTKEINGVKLSLTYRPTELMVSQELEQQGDVIISRDSLMNKYKNNLYFILSYSKNDNEILSSISESRQKFNEVQNILTFGMREKVALVNNKKDTIPLLDYNFPRTYGMARSTSLLFIFKKEENFNDSNTVTFYVKDIGLGIGDVKFKYSINTIN